MLRASNSYFACIANCITWSANRNCHCGTNIILIKLLLPRTRTVATCLLHLIKIYFIELKIDNCFHGYCEVLESLKSYESYSFFLKVACTAHKYKYEYMGLHKHIAFKFGPNTSAISRRISHIGEFEEPSFSRDFFFSKVFFY